MQFLENMNVTVYTLIEFGHSGSETLKLVKFDFFFQNLANGSLGVVV